MAFFSNIALLKGFALIKGETHCKFAAEEVLALFNKPWSIFSESA